MSTRGDFLEEQNSLPWNVYHYHHGDGSDDFWQAGYE